MEEKTITISVEEYKKMLEAQVRIGCFAAFVKRNKYNIDKEDCGRFLGFEVKRED